jgi:cobalt/nickel transport system ATP-binding protein
VRDLEYTYPDGTKALCGINLDIFEEECVGIIGPNGAGKTTLLLHLNGILRGEGEVEVMGMEVNEKNLNFIRSKVGLVFQDPDDQLFMPTVFDDVAFGPFNLDLERDEVRERVREALLKVGMLDSAQRVTHHLSVGEKKRVAIAGVLAMRSEILVLDEPTSNLDPRSRRELIKMLKGINCTKIIAGHDLRMILELCGRVILLNAGKKIAEGETSKILGDKEIMETSGLEVVVGKK